MHAHTCVCVCVHVWLPFWKESVKGRVRSMALRWAGIGEPSLPTQLCHRTPQTQWEGEEKNGEKEKEQRYMQIEMHIVMLVGIE